MIDDWWPYSVDSPFAVVDQRHVAVAAAVEAGGDDRAGAGRLDRRAARRADVEPGVERGRRR